MNVLYNYTVKKPLAPTPFLRVDKSNDLEVAGIHRVVLRLPDSWSNWNLEMLVSEERRQPEYPEKNLSEQRSQTKKNSTH